jgi:hypothetical protein
MGKSVENYLLGMELGAVQSFEKMAVFPLITSLNGGPEYITLKEALERGVFSVVEVSHGGSVPDLQAENRGDVAVLLLDGEELAGAKQNRILNTTILIGPKTAIKVPVSCTEQGRWTYVSEEFAESGNIMARSLRSEHMREVQENLAACRQYRSNQGEVWNRIADMSLAAGVKSATGAMRDVFSAKKTDLDDYLKSFRIVEGQKGMLVVLDGRAVGLDFVSRPEAFAKLFPKLIKSYAMEAVLSSETRGKKKAKKARKQAKKDENQALETPSAENARAFLKAAAECDEQRHDSVGMGSYYRYGGSSMVGSALAVEDKVVHMAFFSVAATGEAARINTLADMRFRRSFRVD